MAHRPGRNDRPRRRGRDPGRPVQRALRPAAPAHSGRRRNTHQRRGDRARRRSRRHAAGRDRRRQGRHALSPQGRPRRPGMTHDQGGSTMATTQNDVRGWSGRALVVADGDKIGTIEEIYLDAETSEPEWAVVSTGLFGTKQSFVLIGDASSTGDGIRVPFEKATVKDAPKIDPDGRLSQEEERELYRHYGRDYADFSGPGGSGTDTGVVDSDRETGQRFERDAA